MSFWQILLLAVGLAMDATAVAAARGCASGSVRQTQGVLRVAILFGLAQALMPLLGSVLGERFGSSVAAFDHWIAFVLLAAVGAKMLHEARAKPSNEPEQPGYDFRLLLGLAVATSIDAFAVGLTLPMLHAPFWPSIITIGVVTALLSGLGVLIGQRAGKVLGHKLDAFGGVVLILLGFKILAEHLAEHGL